MLRCPAHDPAPHALRLPFCRLSEAAIPPKRAHDGDAGYDLSSVEEVTLAPGERALVRIGIALAIPEGYAGLVLPRSGLAVRHGVSLVNAPGLIDSGYRGEVKVSLINYDRRESFTIEFGMRVAQLLLVRAADTAFVAVELSLIHI